MALPADFPFPTAQTERVTFDDLLTHTACQYIDQAMLAAGFKREDEQRIGDWMAGWTAAIEFVRHTNEMLGYAAIADHLDRHARGQERDTK